MTSVPSRWISRCPRSTCRQLRAGQGVAARTNAWPGRDFSGKVVSVDSRVDPATRAVTVRAVVPNPDGALKPGMFLTVSVAQDRRPALVIPEEALVPEQARQFVYVMTGREGGQARGDAGAARAGFVEITSGLAGDDQVVIEGTLKLRDGAPVRDLGADGRGRHRPRRRAGQALRLMTISELSIRRPVFATVLALLLLITGVMAALRLSVREYPDISQPVVTVNVSYRGANAAVIETRITQVIENEVAGLEGVDKLTSRSRDERAEISVQFTTDRNMDDAANDVRDRVTRIVARLPDEADPPQIQKVDSDADPVLFVILTSNRRNGLALTDYAERYLVDRLGARAGRGQRVHQRCAPLFHARLAGPHRHGGAPRHGDRHRGGAAQREHRAAGRPHRVAPARVHAAHRDRDAQRG